MADPLDRQSLLAAIPQQAPFRFIDEVLEVDERRIVGAYRFREDEFFYAGHFPGRPITPGVILIETLAQTGVVAFGLYLASLAREDTAELTTVFTESSVEFGAMVRPGERVTVEARKIYFRRRKLKVAAEMKLADGTAVCWGDLAGMGVQLP